MTPPQLASSLSHSAVTPAVDVKGSLPPNTPASHGHKPRQPSCRLPRRPLAVLGRDILPIIAHASLRCHRTRRPCHRPRRASPFAGHDRTFSGRPATPLGCRRRELRRPLPIWLRGCVCGGLRGQIRLRGGWLHRANHSNHWSPHPTRATPPRVEKEFHRGCVPHRHLPGWSLGFQWRALAAARWQGRVRVGGMARFVPSAAASDRNLLILLAIILTNLRRSVERRNGKTKDLKRSQIKQLESGLRKKSSNVEPK